MALVFDGRPTGSAGSTTDAPWAGLNWGGSIDGTPPKGTSFGVVSTQRRYPHAHQQVSIRYTTAPTGGTLTLTYSGQTTAALDWDATAAEVKTALDNLSNIEVGDVVVTGGPWPTAPIGITFSGGTKASTAQSTITAASSLTGGTDVSVSVWNSFRPNAFRFRVADGDQYGNSSGERTEETVYTGGASIAPGVGARHGASLFYAFSVYLPATTTPNQTGYGILWQLKHITTATFSPNYGLGYVGGEMAMFCNGGTVNDDCIASEDGDGISWTFHGGDAGSPDWTVLSSADITKDDWMDFLIEVRGARDNTGYFKVWTKLDGDTAFTLGLDTSGTPHPTVWNTSKPSGNCVTDAQSVYTDDHLRTGLYRHASNSNTFEYFSTAPIVFGTLAEAQVLLGATSVTTTTPADGVLPAAATGKTRVGKTTVGATRSGIGADRKRGSRYLFPAGSVSTSYVHLQSEATSGTQVFRHMLYAEDASGEPGAFVAMSDELTITCPEDPVWSQFTWTLPPAMTAGYYWMMLWSGATTQLCKYASAALTGGLRFGTETYDAVPTNPSAAMSTDAIEISQVVDITPSGATGGSSNDTTAPTVHSAEILTNTLQIAFNEPLGSTVPATSAFSVTFNGAQQTISSVTVSGDTAELTLSGPNVLFDETVLVSYTQPATNRLADVAGNVAASFTDQAVTNIAQSLDGLGRVVGTAGRIIGGTRTVGGSRVIGAGGGGGA